jgi:hypothetical protein
VLSFWTSEAGEERRGEERIGSRGDTLPVPSHDHVPGIRATIIRIVIVGERVRTVPN